jgi:hypothetical protein
MLRLKGEQDGALHEEDEARSSLHDTEETDEITSESAFRGEDAPTQEPDWEQPDGTPRLRGPAIAVTAFVPTFLLIFFGLPYLVGTVAPARTPTPSVVTGPRVATGPTVAPDSVPVPKPPTRAPEAVRPTPGGLVSRDPLPVSPLVAEKPKTEEPAPPPAAQPAPALPPARPTPAEPPAAAAPASAPRVPETSRQANAPPPTPEPRATAEPRPAPEARRAPREPRDWTPAAAFTDRAAAGRLASSIEQQGYPVEIRQEASSSRPWVVWIGAQPSSSGRRR